MPSHEQWHGSTLGINLQSMVVTLPRLTSLAKVAVVILVSNYPETFAAEVKSFRQARSGIGAEIGKALLTITNRCV